MLNATEQRHDAQRLKLTIERHIVYPLVNLFATDQIHVGDIVRIDWDHNQHRLNCIREVKDLLAPLRRFEPEALAGFVPTNTVEFVEALAVRRVNGRTPRCGSSVIPEGDPCWRVRCRVFACGSRAWSA